MTSLYRCRCPSCGTEHELKASKWLNRPAKTQWSCPGCAASLASIPKHRILTGVLGMLVYTAAMFSVHYWDSVWPFVTASLVFSIIILLLDHHRVVKITMPAKDFVNEELKTDPETR